MQCLSIVNDEAHREEVVYYLDLVTDRECPFRKVT